MKPYRRIAWLLVLGMGLLFLDFVTKAYVYNLLPLVEYTPHIYPYGGVGVFENFMGIECSISIAINRGAAWGIFANFQHLLLSVRIVVIVAMLLYLIFLNKKREADWPLVLIISGALGNVVDFFLYGYVIDFIHFKFWGYDFPVFNVADVSITVGVFWLFFLAFFSKKKRQCLNK